MPEVKEKPRQWLGAEIPWDNYKRYIDYVYAHKAQGMTVGKLIVAGVECYFAALTGKAPDKDFVMQVLGFDPTGVPPKAGKPKSK